MPALNAMGKYFEAYVGFPQLFRLQPSRSSLEFSFVFVLPRLGYKNLSVSDMEADNNKHYWRSRAYEAAKIKLLQFVIVLNCRDESQTYPLSLVPCSFIFTSRS